MFIIRVLMFIIHALLFIDINNYYACFKTGSYFQLKCSTPFSLLSNVVHKLFVRVMRVFHASVWLRDILVLGFRNICTTKP